MPAPALPAYVLAVTSALAAGSAVGAGRSGGAVVLSAPAASVASVTTMSLVGIVISEMPLLASVSAGSWGRQVPSVPAIDRGEFAAPAAGALNSAVMLLPPFWPMALESR